MDDNRVTNLMPESGHAGKYPSCQYAGRIGLESWSLAGLAEASSASDAITAAAYSAGYI
jgi:hypothetical protein